MQLSDRQQAIIDFVDSHMELHGYPPTVREICTGVGLNSPSTVHAHLGRPGAHGPAAPRSEQAARPRHGRARGARRGGRRPSETAGVRVLPLLGQIAAGAPILAEEHVEDASRCPRC